MRKQVQRTLTGSIEGYVEFDYEYVPESQGRSYSAKIDGTEIAQELAELVNSRAGNYRITIELLPDDEDD